MMKLDANEISVQNLYLQGKYTFSDYVQCDPFFGGCGKIMTCAQHDKLDWDSDDCCAMYSIPIFKMPELAYGGHEIEGWAYVRKPLTMLMSDVDYVLGMGHVKFKLERRKVKGHSIPVPVVMVPKHLKGRAEWLFEEWEKAEKYRFAATVMSEPMRQFIVEDK